MAKTIDTTLIVQPAVRVLTDWKPASIRSALAQADGGTQRTIADITDCLLGDERVSGAMSGRVRTLLGCPLTFEVGQKGDRTKELDEDWWSMAPEAELSLTYMTALIGGRGVARMQHAFDVDKKRWIPLLEPWHPQLVREDTETKKLWAKVNGDIEEEILPGDGKWLVVAPYGQKRPWALALWRGLSPWWLLKQYAINDWGNHSDKACARTVESPIGTTAAQRRELAADIGTLARNGVLVLPPGFKLELVEATADTRDIYGAQIEAANAAITIAIRGSNLGTETTGGSLAAAKQQGGQDDDLKRFDGGVLSTQTRPLIQQWTKINFGDPAQAPWAKWETEPREDLAKKVETQTKAAAAVKAWQDLGVIVDVQATAKDAGVIIDETQKPVPVLKGEIYKYHLDYGVFSKNEIRASRGAQPVAGGEKPPEPIANPPATGAQASYLGVLRAANGDPIPAKGLVEGQTYADGLTISARDRATAAMAADLTGLLKVIEATEEGPGWGDRLQAALVEYFGNMDASSLAEVTEKALVLAELCGRHAVLEDL